MSRFWRRNNTNNNNNGSYGNQQMQKQTFAGIQKQQVAQTQTFIEQVDDTIECISLAGEAFSKGMDENTVNFVCDGAVISLNMFAVSCEQLYKEKDKKAIKLGKKRVIDKLTELASKDFKVYELIEPHRQFITAALNGKKNLRYRTSRVVPGVESLFDNADNVNKAFGNLIQNNQRADKRQEEMMQPGLNQKLAKEHQQQLNEYDNNARYHNNNSSAKATAGGRANLTDLYFTKSGKSATFTDPRAGQQTRAEQKARDEDLHGPEPDVYDKILPREYLNAVLLLSSQTAWNNIDEPIPCQILVPSKHKRAKQDKKMIKILPCYPNNNCTLDVSLDLLELRKNKIQKIENQYIRNLKKYSLNVPNPALGYKSIAEQDKERDEIDLDFEMAQ